MTPRVVLVGPPAAGKTTVGTAVARALRVGFRDTDADVEASTGTPVAQLFAEQGERWFRQLERDAVARALREHDGVLALGGGAVTEPATRRLLVLHGRSGGAVVRLDVDVDSAVRRVGANPDRPLLAVDPGARLRALLAERAPLYAEVATAAVTTTGRAVAAVAAEVLAVLTRPAGAAEERA